MNGGSRENSDCVANIKGMSFTAIVSLFGRFISWKSVEARSKSRKRVFSDVRTFWLFLAQIIWGNLSCDAILQKAITWLESETKKEVSPNNSGYTQARQRFPSDMIRQASDQALTKLPPGKLFHGHAVKQVDGTGATMADTEANRQEYPYRTGGKSYNAFPAMNLLLILDWLTGTILDWAGGNAGVGEASLFLTTWPGLNPGDLVIGDRGFCGYWQFWWVQHHRGAFMLTRVHGARKHRRIIKDLGPNDHLVAWTKSTARPRWLTAEEWEAVPRELIVREISADISRHGFRVRNVTIVTTLLDETIPADELLDLYRDRWNIEVNLRNLKITLGIDILRGKTPEMIAKEVSMFLLAYNLIRTIMCEAAERHNVPLERISFKATMTAIETWGLLLAKARTRAEREALLQQFYRVVAYPRCRNRRGRSEPRAVKRR
ncbi:MAG: IS4 family transposase, partial [Bacteroidota bacterium]